VKNQEGSRKRFHDLCEKKQLLYKGINTIKLNDVIEAFAAARLTPMLTKQEFSDLFYALEVFKDQDAETVLWQDLLKAPHAREPNAFKGIFPIVVSSTANLTFALETQGVIRGGAQRIEAQERRGR
jgi:hypothetical protein